MDPLTANTSLEDTPLIKAGNVETRVLFKPSFDNVTHDDITVIFSVRLHSENPWLVPRLRDVCTYYDPLPSVVVVDFGSEPDFASVLQNLCMDCGYVYHFVEDREAFSLAAARNTAATLANTDFLFFCDPDFTAERDLFAKLAKNASALNMRSVIDIILNPPAVHLGEGDTEVFDALAEPPLQSSFLRYLSFKTTYSEYNKATEQYVAPYSNVFLMNAKMFSMVGGYDSRFRGHGSEDFEFLLRLSFHSQHLPIPSNPQSDDFGPLRANFFDAKPYSGFRRLFELMSYPTESLGLKVFHRYHPRAGNPEWYASGDQKRSKFKEASNRYISSPHRLLEVDFLPRAKKIACLCKAADHWGYFLPLRLAGYELVPVFDVDADTLGYITQALIDGEISDVAIFNPYMKSHAAFRPLVALARELEREVVVLERGALPATIYYDTDVCYASPAYSEDAFNQAVFSADELARAQDYVGELSSGSHTLEKMDTYSATYSRHLALASLKARKVFVPLQLEDDMAVTMFITGDQNYPDFVASLPAIVKDNPDIIFIIKPHPLSTSDSIPNAPNVVVAAREDNVHTMLDIADATLCYNSGVGLLSILHGTTTITLGNAFYNIGDAGYRASSAAQGIEALVAGKARPPTSETIQRLAAWFTQRKYSKFIAIDDIRHFKHRKSHGYKNILVTEFRWREHFLTLARLKQTVPFAWNSYAGSKIAPFKKGPDTKARDIKTYLNWARKDFKEAQFGKAAAHYTRAYHMSPTQPKYLRLAAEAHWRNGDKRAAILTQAQAVAALPGNKRTQRRLLSMKYPILRLIIGTNAYSEREE